jgi:hypothetical protein
MGARTLTESGVGRCLLRAAISAELHVQGGRGEVDGIHRVHGRDEVKLDDGKIDGNNFSFSITFDFGGMPFTIAYKGVLANGQVKLTGDIMGMPIEILLKKSS